MKREFLMLAQKYNPSKHDVGGYYLSEKMDGQRCLWDGGISRGMPTELVPWANITHPKTGERKTKIKPESSGLWSRYGNPIIAPNWWLNLLPCMPLDGELWAGRGGFQLCRSICSRDLPSSDWEQIEFAVIGSPPFESIFASGTINNTNMRKDISLDVIKRWLNTRPESILRDFRFLKAGTIFEDELLFLNDAIPSEGLIYLLKQKKLPNNPHDIIEDELSRILDDGGEGVVLRKPTSIWTPKRSWDVLKYKPFIDDEGTLVGFTSGRKTDKGSKLLGKIGALILDYNGKRLELSGLTDKEREFSNSRAVNEAIKNPGVDMPNWVEARYFKRGQRITFIYRELSDDKLPKEARYFRQQGLNEED